MDGQAVTLEFRRGCHLVMLNLRYELAERHVRRAIALDPNLARAWRDLSNVLAARPAAAPTRHSPPRARPERSHRTIPTAWPRWPRHCSGPERIEARYRRLLALYPIAYRREHETEMLATLMKANPNGNRWRAGREALAEFWTLPTAVLFGLPLLWSRPDTSRRPLAWLLAPPAALLVFRTDLFDWPLHAIVLPTILVLSIILVAVDARAPIVASALVVEAWLTSVGLPFPRWSR